MQIAALISIVILAALATDAVVPIIPVIENALDTDAASAQMLISVFLAGYAAGQLPCGIASDRLGRMPVLYSALSIFVIGSVICVVADSINGLFAGRFIQGLGAAGTAVMSRTIARDLHSGSELAKLLALYVAVLASLPIVGPALGSWLGATLNWQSVFVLITAAGAISLVLSFLGLKETHSPDAKVAQQKQSLAETFRIYFHSKQSIWASLLLGFVFFGFMSILSGFGNAIVDVYQRPAIEVGPLLSATMLFFVGGSITSRQTVSSLGELTLIKYAAYIFVCAAFVNGFVLLAQPVHLYWFMLSIVLYALGLGLLFPNTSSLALAPLPKIAGLASSILGTIQISFAFAGSAFTAYLYAGDLKHIAIPLLLSSVGVVLMYLCRSRYIEQA